MQCRLPKNNKKQQKPWVPRAKVLIPAHRIIKSKKEYERKREKHVASRTAEWN